jgi:DNA anti-recombination protein RmuC
MPVTAKLSQKFYDRFGDDLTNELVNWLNQVDATYRSDLRELNDLNFARFDANLAQRAAQLDAKIAQRTAELDAKIEQRTAQLDARIEQRVAQLEAKIEQRAAQLDAKMDARFAEFRTELRTGLARLEGGLIARIGLAESRQTRLTLAVWVATLGALAALLKL